MIQISDLQTSYLRLKFWPLDLDEGEHNGGEKP